MTLGWLCCLAALLAVAAGSRQSDVYVVTPSATAPTLSWYIDNWEHYHSKVSDEPYYTGGAYETAAAPFAHTFGGYWAYYYKNVPLNPGVVLGFSVPSLANNGLAAWIRTEWFQSFYSRSCQHNYYMSSVDNCTDRPVFHCAVTAGSQWLIPGSTDFTAMDKAYFTERPVNPSATTEWGQAAVNAFPLPLESYILSPTDRTNSNPINCRFVIPSPVFADMHVFPSTDDCYKEYTVKGIMHPVEFLLGGNNQALSLYPPIRFTYYGQPVWAMTMYTSGVVRFSDYDVNVGLTASSSASSGAYLFFPSSTFDVDWKTQAPYIYPGYANVTEPKYKATWPAWVFWDPWWKNDVHQFVGEDIYYNRYCSLSVFGDRYDLGDWDADTNKMVYVYYGMTTDANGKQVFVINYQNLGYYAAATPMSDAARLHFQLHIYPDTQANSLMYLQYVNVGQPNERFRAKLAGVDYKTATLEATTDGNVNQFTWWAFGKNDNNDLTHDRFNYQVPTVGLRSCDGVWGGLYTESAGSLFPAKKCVRIMGCLNSYYDSVSQGCVCAERFTNFTASAATDYACMPCSSMQYKSVTGNFKCHSCPHYSTAPAALYGMDDNSECECDAYYGGNAAQKLNTYYHNDQLVTSAHPCEECAGDLDYKRHKGNEDCHCTDGCNTQDTDEDDKLNHGWGQCQCKCGSYGHGFRRTSAMPANTCLKCNYGRTPSTYFKNYVGNCDGQPTNCFASSCAQCPAQSASQATLTTTSLIGVAGLASADECGCQCATYATWNTDNTKTNTGNCLCMPGTYWPTSNQWNVGSCTVCGNNTVKFGYSNEPNRDVACRTCSYYWANSYGLVQTNVNPLDHDGPEDCGCVAGWGIWGNGSSSVQQSWTCHKCGFLTNTFTGRPSLAHASCQCDTAANAAGPTILSGNPDEIQCQCAPGYTLTTTGGVSSCTPCADNFYKSWVGNGACSPCGTNAYTNSSTGKIHCACRQAGMYYVNSTESCQNCAGNTYLDAWNCGIECAPAQFVAGTFNCSYTGAQQYGVRYHRFQQCLACPYNSAINSSVTESPQKRDTIDDCRCNAGFYQVPTHTACDTVPTVVCAECAEGTYQPYSNVHPTVCPVCPASMGFTQSPPRSDSINDCLCPKGKYFDVTNNLCTACPVNSFMPQVYRQQSQCFTCGITGMTYAAASADGTAYNQQQCIPYSKLPQITNSYSFYEDNTDYLIKYLNHNIDGVADTTPRNSPAWATEDYLNRAVYMRLKAQFVADNGDPASGSLTWTSIPNNKLLYQVNPYYVVNDQTPYKGFTNAYWSKTYQMNGRGIGRGYYYDLVFNDMTGLGDFGYLMTPARVGHSLRVYLAGDEGIYVSAGHEDLVNQPHWAVTAPTSSFNMTDNFYVFPYYCVNYYYMFQNTPTNKYYGAGAYLWDPAAQNVLSWAYDANRQVLFLRIVADMRFTDTYVSGGEKVTIYVAVSHYSKHYMDVSVERAISNTDQCQPRFIFEEKIVSVAVAGSNPITSWHFMDDWPFQYFHDYVYNNYYFNSAIANTPSIQSNRTSATLYQNYMIRFDFDLCIHCKCSATDRSFLVFPTNWDLNGCYCSNGCYVPGTNGACGTCAASGAATNTYNTAPTNANTACVAPPTGKLLTTTGCSYDCGTKGADYSTQCCAEAHTGTASKGWAYNGTACFSCPINTYMTKLVSGSYVCQPCPYTSATNTIGTTTSIAASSVCVGAPTGVGAPYSGCYDVSACTCPTNMVATANGCRCVAGYYHNKQQFSCTACLKGQYKAAPTGADWNTDSCVDCPVNTYQDATGQSTCPACGWCLVTKGLTGRSNASSDCYADYGCGYDASISDFTQCKPGYTHNNQTARNLKQTCIACQANSGFNFYFSDGVWNGPTTAATNTECGCDIDFGFKVTTPGNINKCVACNATAGEYKKFRGNSACQTCGYISDYRATLASKVGTTLTRVLSVGAMGAISGGTPMETLQCAAPMGTVLGKYVWLSDAPIGSLPRGTFKGEASFSRVSVYVRDHNVIHFALETDDDVANSAARNTATWVGDQMNYRTDAAFKLCTNALYSSANVYYDLGVLLGYRIDVETLKVAVQTSTAASDIAAIVQVSFDFEGVYTSSTNMSNIIQLVVPMRHDQASYQYALLNFVSFPTIATPVVVNLRDYHRITKAAIEDHTYPTDAYTSCRGFFNRFSQTPATDSIAYTANPMLCRVHDKYYLDALYREYNKNQLQFRIDFIPDQACTPKTCAVLHGSEGANAAVVGSDYRNCLTCSQAYGSQMTNKNGVCGCIVDNAIPSGTGTSTQCQCAAGYYYTVSGSSFTCTRCTPPLVKETAGNTACLSCPTGSSYDTTLNVVENLSACKCNSNYTHIKLGVTGTDRNSWCTACPAYSRKDQNKPCTTGSDRSMLELCICNEWFASINKNWECACNPGYYGTAQWAANYDTSVNNICTACPKNYYTATEYVNNNNQNTRCVKCDSTGIALTPYDASWGYELCYCPAGYGGFPGVPSTPYPNCVKCAGGVKNYDGTGVCVCSDSHAIATPGLCQCFAGYEGDATSGGNSTCAMCKPSYYKSSIANARCTACPANSFSNVTGATSPKDCTCNTNYWGVATNGTNCSYCFLGTKPAGNNLTCNCKSSAIRGATAHDCVCAAGKGYVSAQDTCTNCPLNTYKAGQNRNTCSSCPAHSTTDAVASTAQTDCICDIMYEPGKLTGSSDYCVPCPVHYAKGRGNFACTFVSSSFVFASSASYEIPSSVTSLPGAASSTWPALAMLLITLLALALNL